MTRPQSPYKLTNSRTGDTRHGAVAIGGLTLTVAPALKRKGTVMTALIADWAAIAGPGLAAYTIPQKITKGANQETSALTPSNLHLRVDPARALDVQYRVPQLIERINQSLGYNAIGAIRLVQSPLHAKPQKLAQPQPQTEMTQPSNESRLDRALARMQANRAASGKAKPSESKSAVT